MPRADDLPVIRRAYRIAERDLRAYEPDGRPVNRRFFQAEFPFAWNAGLFVYAVHACGLADNEGAQAP